MKQQRVITTAAEQHLLIEHGIMSNEEAFSLDWDCSIGGMLIFVDDDCKIGHSMEEWENED